MAKPWSGSLLLRDYLCCPHPQTVVLGGFFSSALFQCGSITMKQRLNLATKALIHGLTYNFLTNP